MAGRSTDRCIIVGRSEMSLVYLVSLSHLHLASFLPCEFGLEFQSLNSTWNTSDCLLDASYQQQRVVPTIELTSISFVPLSFIRRMQSRAAVWRIRVDPGSIVIETIPDRPHSALSRKVLSLAI